MCILVCVCVCDIGTVITDASFSEKYQRQFPNTIKLTANIYIFPVIPIVFQFFFLIWIRFQMMSIHCIYLMCLLSLLICSPFHCPPFFLKFVKKWNYFMHTQFPKNMSTVVLHILSEAEIVWFLFCYSSSIDGHFPHKTIC